MSRGRAVKFLLYALVLACIAYFFYRAFQKNWHSIQAHDFVFDYLSLSLGVLCLLATYLLATYAWHRSINALSATAQLRLTQSMAAVNAANLTKYLPGKFWSFALQLYWLSSAGFSKSLVTYVNLLNLYISIVTTLLTGLLLLLLSPSKLAPELTLAALGAIVLLDVVSVKFHAPLFRGGIALVNRLFKRDLKYFEPKARVWLELHVLHLVAALTFGLAAYFTSHGIGYSLGRGEAPLVMSALLIADLVGFAAIFVPGGLGVREGFMYVMLGGSASGSLALTLPLAIRMLNMLVDLALGGLALHLSREFNRQKPGDAPPPQEIVT
jgi:glycosyltransferase 2 family protein